MEGRVGNEVLRASADIEIEFEKDANGKFAINFDGAAKAEIIE